MNEYWEVAKRVANANDPAGLTEYMLELSAAITYVSEQAIALEAALLRESAKRRAELLTANPKATEARLKAAVEVLTIDERMKFREADSLLRALHQRFKAVQSALSYRKAEMRI